MKDAIVAQCVEHNIVVSIQGEDTLYRLERHTDLSDWQVYTTSGWQYIADIANSPMPIDADAIPAVVLLPVKKDFLDTNVDNALYAYRAIVFDKVRDYTPDIVEDAAYIYSNWVKGASSLQLGYSFANYSAPEGLWGEIVTADDLRYTYLWGTDFKAANGQSFTDEQIRYFINAATRSLEKELDIDIVKKRLRYSAKVRGLIKGKDYDVEEAPYSFSYNTIARTAMIPLRHRPVIALHSLRLEARGGGGELREATIVDKAKGELRLLTRPMRPTETALGIEQAIGMYGTATLPIYLMYNIDYDAGYETSDDVDEDLREIVAKRAAVSLLNVIGDGLMSGFSSSSLSMDGLSESFSSTQSATSAYFGARIKEYKDDIKDYIEKTRLKYSHIAMGCL